ncbi:efflux RND transporter periplasmic adaptor subunit [Psychromonas sp. 14N.309.X.WAT.B.A12]|uniref:efflux RND transporter periplasmic adaptor subunit n=1 Tax=unclassified Psychromonas TaxID=2614957 RepID=UPI0025AFF395|nr:efflux RND transporter periplasmic adaptor subunit [Psychromonas sp. 14N.309.X.WAT.B.A12]MDN2662263.1 efflux RND transporter periplasmic adaptor subunit [Psychromonas sp. 14N.309.X.WAT.B.A12]
MKKFNIIVLALIAGGVIGFASSKLMMGHSIEDQTNSNNDNKSDKPLYWVAPMDANYQRDKPGLSPMGMELVPVYGEQASAKSEQAGTVTIDSSVENNLGVKVEQVSKESLSPRIETVGYIAFDQSQLWQTNVRISGWVDKLYINAVGERVKKGDVLFTFYSPDLVKAQQDLINAFQSGRSGLVNSAKERLTSLGVDSEQIKQIIKAQKTTQNIAVKANADGVIASLNIREGGYISPIQSIISGGPIDSVWVEVEVFERQSEWIKEGTEAVMTLDAVSGKTWRGTVDYIYPILDPETRTLRLRLKFKNPENKLKPNMFANILLQPKSSEKVLTIPYSAVIRANEMTRVVLSEGEGKYRSARISIGREANGRVEVLAGLNEQHTVVTSAHFLLDSESSQSAELSRINGLDEPKKSIWTSGEVTAVMNDHNMLTISHEPIDEWDWPGMVMNFTAVNSLNLNDIKIGQMIDFEIAKAESGGYEILNLKVNQETLADEVWSSGEISMLMVDFNMITIVHEPIDEWQWDKGEMNFSVTNGIDLSAFKEGQKVSFLVSKKAGDYSLEQLELFGGEQ